jgi:hypothetical protein
MIRAQPRALDARLLEPLTSKDGWPVHPWDTDGWGTWVGPPFAPLVESSPR